MLVLHYYLGLSLDEAADALGIPPGTVRSAFTERPRRCVPRSTRTRAPSSERKAAGMTARDDLDRHLAAWLRPTPRCASPSTCSGRSSRGPLAPGVGRPGSSPKGGFRCRPSPPARPPRHASRGDGRCRRAAHPRARRRRGPRRGYTPAGAARPFGPAANGLLVFEAAGDIHTLDPTTGERRAIVTGETIDTGPVWFRDGSRLVFSRTEGELAALYVVNPGRQRPSAADA